MRRSTSTAPRSTRWCPACASNGPAPGSSRAAPTSKSPPSTPPASPRSAAAGAWSGPMSALLSRDALGRRLAGRDQRRAESRRACWSMPPAPGATRSRPRSGSARARPRAAAADGGPAAGRPDRASRPAVGHRPPRSFYFKGEGDNSVWVCPLDETLVDPCDAAPEEIDVAIAIDRFEQAVDWPVEAVERKWAGLRTFAPDRAR